MSTGHPLSTGAALPAAATSPERIEDQVGAAVEHPLQHLRFVVPWAQVQTRPGTLDGRLIEDLRAAALLCRQHGIEPWFSLLQHELPDWFENEGGWTDPRFAGRTWPRWVEAVAEALGDVTAGWVPMPYPFAIATRSAPGNARVQGEVFDTLVVAWRDSWRILRGGPPVMSALDVKVVRPENETVQAGRLARREDQLRWGLWLDGMSTGNVAIPGRADRELADLSGSVDIVGIAATGDVETLLHRTAEMAPADHPLALTFAPTGTSAAQRDEAVEKLWPELDRAVAELPMHSVTFVVEAVDQLRPR